MKEIDFSKRAGQREKDMAEYILVLLRGKKPSVLAMTERFRQYCTWGARNFRYIISKCGCYGVQFNVSGLTFKGRVRVWYNPASDYFDVEFLRAIKETLVKGLEDLDFEQLHNVLHCNIERTDDPEV